MATDRSDGLLTIAATDGCEVSSALIPVSVVENHCLVVVPQR